VLYFYFLKELQAVRSGRWKLHVPHGYGHVSEPGHDGSPGKTEQRREELALYDLENDRGETKNVAADHPDVVKRLLEFVEQAREDLGDSATGRKGANVRAAGQVES
jgi:arylsulfatase A